MDYSIKDAFKSLAELSDDIEVKKEKKIIKESLEEEPIKEGYIGQTVKDFIKLCVDPSSVETFIISNIDADDYEEAFRGSYDKMPDHFNKATYADFDCGDDKVVINAHPTENGGDEYYEFVKDFVEDFNGNEISIQVDGKEVFTGDKYEIPEDMENYYFHSFDAPKYLCVNAKDIEVSESLNEQKLEEKLPKDLADAYRRAVTIGERSNANFYADERRSSPIDYEAANYEEITPERAIEIKKNGEADKLRILIGKNLINYREDGYPIMSVEVGYGSDKAYTNRNNKKITDTRYMPFTHVVKIADKIYLTDEKEHVFPIGHWEGDKWIAADAPVPQKRIQQKKDLTPDTGKHIKKDTGYGTRDYYETSAKNYEKEVKKLELDLAKLELDWENGDISKNNYEKGKENIKNSIARYEKWAQESKDDAIRVIGKVKDKAARDRYELAAQDLQKNIDKYNELKRQIKTAEWSLNRLKEKGSLDRWELKGGSYKDKVAKIEEIKAQMEVLQKQLDKLQSEATDELKQANIDQNTKALEDAENKVNNFKDELNKLLRKDTKENLEEDLVNLNDKEEIEKEKEKLDKEQKELPIEQVVDVDATIVDDLKDSYIGRAILQCPTCKTLLYKKLEELAKEDEENNSDPDKEILFNVEEECPHCGAKDGFKLIGQVAALNKEESGEEKPEEVKEEKPEEKEVEKKEIEVKEEEKEVKEESLTDFDEKSFDEHVTKYLQEVYDNIESYHSTDGSIKDNDILIEGIIKFKSGKEKDTSFKLKMNEGCKITGLNESFSNSDEIYEVEGRIENNAFITENIKYKYTIEDQLVEGCTKVEEAVEKTVKYGIPTSELEKVKNKVKECGFLINELGEKDGITEFEVKGPHDKEDCWKAIDEEIKIINQFFNID